MDLIFFEDGYMPCSIIISKVLISTQRRSHEGGDEDIGVFEEISKEGNYDRL